MPIPQSALASEAGTIRLFGCDLAPLTMDETVEQVRRIIATRKPTQHIVLNAFKVVMMHEDPEIAKIVRGCPLVSIDGQSIVWAARLMGHRIPERVAGIDLMNRLLAESERAGWHVFFLGATRDVLDRFVDVVGARHPDLEIAGSRDGYFSNEEEDQVADEIAAASPDLLFVGITSPKKELFLARHLDRMGVPFAMGVGGAFDVESGLVRRAPAWMRRAGLEWLYRSMQEPRRLWRVAVNFTRFGVLALRERFRRG